MQQLNTPLRPPYLLVLLLAVVALAGCSTDEEPVSVRALDLNPAPTAAVAGTSDDTARELLTRNANLQAARQRDVLFVQGNQLLRLEGGASAPTTMVEYVEADDVYVLDTKNYLIYAAVESYTNVVWALNLDTNERTELLRTRSSFSVTDPTPYPNWVALALGRSQQRLFRLDGGGVELPSFDQISWLANDEALLIEGNYTRQLDSDYWVLQPNTAHRVSMLSAELLETYHNFADFEPDPRTSFQPQLIDYLELTPRPNPASLENLPPAAAVSYTLSDFPSRDALCVDIDVLRQDGANATPIYSATDVASVHVRRLPNGDALILEWRVPECGLTTPPDVTVLRYRNASDTLEPLAIAPFGGLAFNQKTDANVLRLNDDGTTALWIGGSAAANTISLNLLDLETGENLTIYRNTLTTDFIYRAFWG